MSCAVKLICNNKKAYHNYFISQTYEAGIVLLGSEVKSVRAGGISILDSFVSLKNGEVWLKNAFIKPYEKATSFTPDKLRNRKLLLNKEEINKISKFVVVKGNAIVPLKVYIKDGLVKVEIGIGKGKKLYDKRETLKSKDVSRMIERELKNRWVSIFGDDTVSTEKILILL